MKKLCLWLLLAVAVLKMGAWLGERSYERLQAAHKITEENR